MKNGVADLKAGRENGMWTYFWTNFRIIPKPELRGFWKDSLTLDIQIPSEKVF